MNKHNSILWGMVKIAAYLLIVIGIVGVLTVFIVIPQWVQSTEILVPNLVNKPFYKAIQTLKNNGLEVAQTIQVESSNEPKGNVIVQEPLANINIKPHHTVKLTVSAGPDLTPVPSVIGKAMDAAYETLEAAGFKANSVAKVHSVNYLPETIIAQTPAEGSQQNRGITINLLVSLGRKPQPMQLPDMQNQLVKEVLPALKALGLNVEIKNIPHPRIEQGRIITHKKLVQTGDFITLEVSGKRDETENSGKWLPHKHTVSQDALRSREVIIVVVDEYGEREVVKGTYAPGTVIDLVKHRVKVFGPTLVIVFEGGKKMYERNYQ